MYYIEILWMIKLYCNCKTQGLICFAPCAKKRVGPKPTQHIENLCKNEQVHISAYEHTL